MKSKFKIIFAGSAGGHITELFAILDKEVRGDSEVIVLTEETERTKSFKWKKYFFKPMGYNPILYLPALLRCLFIFKKEKINLVITNGAEIGVPSVIAAKLLGIKTIFIDISAAASVPHLAGKFCYPFSDYFFIQYPEMKKHYGKRAKYAGGII